MKTVIMSSSSELKMSEQVIPPKTKAIFDRLMSSDTQTGGAGGSSTLQGLIQLDANWNKLKNGSWRNIPPVIVTEANIKVQDVPSEFDVSVIGGTLGIFYATALAKLGYKVCIIERGKVVGRSQEWNISKKELSVLLKLGLLTSEDLMTITSIEFNPVRVGFKTDTSPTSTSKGYEVYVQDILNMGIKPNVLIELVKLNFLELGGIIYENASLQDIKVYENIAMINYEDNNEKKTVSSRIVIDAMGNASPIAKQIRGSVQPDGICGKIKDKFKRVILITIIIIIIIIIIIVIIIILTPCTIFC